MKALRQVPEPTVRHIGDHLITAQHLGRRSDAVLGAYGWTVCWRAGYRRQLWWLSLPTRAQAERAVYAAVTGGVA